MTFPNAAKGIKKLFIAEILALIAGVALGCSVFVTESVVSETATNGEVTLVVAFLGIGSILFVISLIIQLIGIANASKDEEAFRSALYMVFFTMIVAVAGAVLAYLFPNNSFLNNLPTVIENLADILITFLIIGGISSLGEKLNDVELQEKAAKLLGIILAVIVFKFIGNGVLLLFKENIAKVIITVLGIMIIILNLIQYILYLTLLARAKNTLETR